MTIELAELPYRTEALTPFLSKETLEAHYGKHHRGYVEKLNKLIANTAHQDLLLDEIVSKSHAAGDKAVFNNAAQALNHSFLWASMSPDGGGSPAGPLGDALDTAFGDLDGFREAFKSAAVAQFGSGWVWLVADLGALRIVSTSNADTPIVRGLQPLLTLDVWEHAYYLDYKNERARYIDTFLNDCINWSFATRNFELLPMSA